MTAAAFLKAGTLVPLCCLVGCLGGSPRIESIDPRIGNRGEVLTIKGSGFRQDRGESRVVIADTAPTASSYIEWSDARISVRIPDFGESGLVYVFVDGKKSNPALYTNRASVPQPISSEDAGIAPRAVSVDPPKAAIGSAITISGLNFGAARENGAVLFAWDSAAAAPSPAVVRAPDSIEASDIEFAYEQWSDREIRVRVPDGAVSGNLRVRTERGTSEPLYFEIADRPGTKTYKDKRSYVFTYSAEVSVAKSSGPNILYLWMPLPASAPYQRNRQLVSRSADPFVDGHRGASLFQFKDLSAGKQERVILSYLVDSYAVETDIKAAQIKKEQAGPIRSSYTLPSALVPSDDKEIVKLAERLAGKERNPYTAARRIYDWLRTDAGIGTEARSGGALEALTEKKADAYAASLLFCALARARGIPAVPISGYLVDRSRKSLRHWWAEFWLDGFGWVPVDPSFGAGAAPEGFAASADAKEYYFGNIDSQRIVFSRGQAELSPMDPRGKTTTRTRSYAFQTIWEESVGGIEAYSSLWNDIEVTGVY